MNRSRSLSPLAGRAPRRRQQGLVLIFVLVALLILGIGAVALIRSFDTSTVNSANLGFKRDLTNEGQLAIAQAKSYFSNASALGSTSVQQSNNTSYNYYSTTLDTDSHGIPKVLLVTTPTALQLPSGGSQLSGITIYYVIDRMCFTGTVASVASSCMFSQFGSDKGGTSGMLKAGASSSQVFRISVRVDGPHNTHAFLQQTVAASF